MQLWHPVLSSYSFQLVVQGEDFNKALDCYMYLLEMADEQNRKLADAEVKPVTTLALPLGVGCAHIDKQGWAMRREALFDEICQRHVWSEDINIHLMSIVDPAEISGYLLNEEIPIRSFDTGTPLRSAKAGDRYDPETGKGTRIWEYLNPDDVLTPDQLELAIHNIEVLRRFTIGSA